MDPSSEADYSGNSSSATIKPVSLASKFDCFSDSDWRKLNDNNNYFIRVYQSLINETDITIKLVDLFKKGIFRGQLAIKKNIIWLSGIDVNFITLNC